MADTDPCSLSPDMLAARAAAWRSLDAAILDSRLTPGGAALRFRFDTAVVRTLLELLEAERACCPSLTFDATVTVRIDAPREAREWVGEAFVARGVERSHRKCG